MAALALVELRRLAATPGPEVAIRVYGSCMIVTAGDLDDVSIFEARDLRELVEVSWKVRLVLHVRATNLERPLALVLLEFDKDECHVIAASNLDNLESFKLRHHVKLAERLLLDSWNTKLAVQRRTRNMYITLRRHQDSMII